MKTLFKLIPMLFVMFVLSSNAQEKEKKYYDPSINGMDQVNKAVKIADTESKNVLLVIGGDWCPWCRRLNQYILDSVGVNNFIQDNYVFIKVNYSKENKNLELMKKLGVPQRFGFPVLVVLDQKGNTIHTQDSGLLEKEKSYDPRKLNGFLRNWTVQAVIPENHRDYK